MTEPNYSPTLLDALREALEQTGITRPVSTPLDDDYLVDADLIDLLDVLRGRGWIVQPAPVPAIPVEPLPDGPRAPGAPSDPGAPVLDAGDGPAW